MASRTEIAPLTGLRGVAILLVVIGHNFAFCAPYDVLTAPLDLIRTFALAEPGMTVFFTLSGFVIAYNYWDFGWTEKRGAAAFVDFFYLRLSRLYPALLLFFVLQTKRLVDANWFGTDWPAMLGLHFFSAQTWYPVVLNGGTPDQVGYSIAWSISTEIGMYLLFGAAMLVAGKCGRLRRPLLLLGALAYIAIAAVVAFHYTATAEAITTWPTPFAALNITATSRWVFYMSPYFRFSQFIMGATAALVITHDFDKRWRAAWTIAAWAALAGLAWFYLKSVLTGDAVDPAVDDLILAGLLSVLMANSRADTWINRALSAKSIVFIGTISYSLYLFGNFPIPWTGGNLTGPFSWQLFFGPFVFNFFLSFVFAVMFAYGTYLLLERPGQRWLRALRQKPRPAPVTVRAAAD